MPVAPLEGEVPNEREAEGFVRRLSMKTPQLRFAQQLPFQGSQGGYAAAGGYEPPLRTQKNREYPIWRNTPFQTQTPSEWAFHPEGVSQVRPVGARSLG